MWSSVFVVTVLLSSMKPAEAQGRCNNVQAADIVFLIDGSSSIGRANFLQVKGFMAGIVKPFVSFVGESAIQFAAIQYSEIPRVEFTFSTYLNGTELVNAIQNINYKGGNTRTGAGLKFVADNFFNPATSRDVPKITILVTDGKSQDSVQEPAEKLRGQGVHVFAVGIKSADRNELAQISSEPSSDFTSFVGDFKLLNTLLPLVGPRVCSKAGGVYASDEAFSGPSNIQFTGQTSDSLRFRWAAAGGPVSGYVIQYVPLSGLGQPITAELKQETVSVKQRTFTARELQAGTDYLVTVIAQYPNSVGESVSAKQRTRSLPGVSSLYLIQANFFSLTVGWDQPSSPVQGYRLTYGLRGQPADQLSVQSLSSESTSVTLESLQPDTEYVVSLYPLFPRNSASPSTLSARTLRLEAVKQLSVETESEGSVVLRWRGVSGARAYRLVWGPFTGRNVETVEVDGGREFYTLSSLQPDVEYIITIIPLYEGDTEGPVATARFKIERQEQQVLRAAITSPSSIRLTWRIIQSSQGYRLEWREGEGGRVQSLSFPRGTTAYELTGLRPQTEYIITMYTLFEGREEATPVSTTVREEQPVGRVSNLRVVEALGSTARLGWTGVAGATRYRIVILNTEAGTEEIQTVNGSQTTLDLRDLTPGVSYGVSVTALVGENEGDPVTVYIKPEQNIGRVTNLRVTNANSRRLRIAWTGVGEASGYRVTWRQGNTGLEQSRNLGAEASTFTIDGLQPDEALIVGVATVVDERVGEVVSLSARTNPHGGSVPGLRVVDVTSQRIRVAWSPSPRATGYKVTWRNNGVETTRNVPADVSSYTIDGLQSDLVYTVKVSALSGSREGSPSTLNIRTESDQSVVGTVTSLQIQESQGEIVRVSWVGVQGATSYRVSWRRTDGGEERSQLVGGDVTAVDLERLDPGAQYEVQVMALVQNREGSPVSVRITTPGTDPTAPSLPSTTLRVAEVTQSSVRLEWFPLLGATGYIVRWREDADPGPGSSYSLPAASSSYLVTGLRLGRRYRFSVQPTFQSGPGPESSVDERTVCAGGRLDLVFLVPASTDRLNLARPLRDLVTSAARSFSAIGPRDTQVGVVVYGYRPKTWFLLSRHDRSDTLLQDIQATPFEESRGNNIGEAVTFARQYLLTPSAGRRPTVPGAVVIIADRKSADNLTLAASALRATGVTVLAVAVDQADTEELRYTVTDGSTQNILYARDAAQLDALHSDLADFLCGVASAPVVSPGPQQCTVQCPRGERGERGEKGDRGRDGTDGRNGGPGLDGLPGRDGPRGPQGPAGPPGPPGQPTPFEPSGRVKGEKGERGFPGIDGNPGLPGRPGAPGNAGVPGSQGLPGIRGVSGEPGTTGQQGSKGDKGERGEPGSTIAGGGLPGRKGEPGLPGIPGTPGRPGITGTKGESGVPGLSGQDGRPGIPGTPGLSIKGEKGSSGERGPPGVGSGVAVKGEKGSPGIPGSPGTLGPRGPAGPQGSKGDKGDGGEGLPGPAGRQGEPGDRGPRGPPGEIGSKGDRGQPGEPGSQGDRGERGPAGEVGGKGDAGKPGLSGSPGLRGLPGPSGPPGEKGRDGAPGEPGGSSPGIPGKRGEQGERGIPGLDGQRGEKGEPGQRGEKGSPGLGAAGPKGESGERGLAGISGRPGAKGDAGEPGERGDNGRPGIPGKPGLPGKEGGRGEKGDEGTPGESGLPGKPGERGLRGLAGQPGRPGEKGELGDPGEHGINGSPGPAGLKGDKGSQGLQGPAGPPGKVADIQGQLKGERGDKGDAGSPGGLGSKGQKGESGTPGAAGLRGPEGQRGPAGTRGDTGERGTPGEKGERGASGLDGRPGLDGKPGPLGPAGQRGDSGKQGDPGRDGLPGIRGELGPQGPVGPPGTPGTPGKSGEDGKPGSPGKMGEDGVPGEDGRKGDRGDAGAAGRDGRDGQKGDRGLPGAVGPSGPSGPPGLPGSIGPPGQVVYLKGAEAAPIPGPQGPPGTPGVPGVPGAAGPRGERGPHGLKGETGDPGEDGAPGKPGTAVDVQKALASLGIQVSELKVVVDKKDLLVAPSVQKPEKGAKGDTGDTGQRGPAGLDGARGIPGERGTKGDQGDRGPAGATGPPGRAIGERGPAGPQGPAGESGKPGIPGVPGRTGEVGESGRPGEKGERGDKGDKGEAGKLGLTGPSGPPGQKGASADSVLIGAPGARGPPGFAGQKGDAGAAGPPGPKGDRGFVGPKGDKGERGEHGEKGRDGSEGTPGEPGKPGQDGKAVREEWSADYFLCFNKVHHVVDEWIKE
ncbi:collagen alpha-1(VII) chain [Solea senegalensis]|uniref:Collagen alpha-1(VII) chain n=1 Tax=Solea senegalensis TaxID=28829 RepID=A0AAV6QKC3_SOLSE|nr:collagen alpha-1(VII) chain [Solea senegalensis]